MQRFVTGVGHAYHQAPRLLRRDQGLKRWHPTWQGQAGAAFNQAFVSRNVHYLRGYGDGADGSLNTTSCSAVLLGSSRYAQGENMFRYMQLAYGDSHNHERTVAAGITHNGQAIMQSPEFKALLTELLARP